MSKKQMLGILVMIIGVVLLCYGFYGTSQMNKARGQINTATSIVPDNPAKDVASGILHGEVDKYKTPVMLCYVGGIVFIVGGAALLFMKKKK